MTNIKSMTMEQEIQALMEATKNINVAFCLAYDNGPDIGVRKSGEIGKHDPHSDSIVVNDHCWLIAGDILDAKSYERFTRVARVCRANPNELKVHLRAQAMIAGTFVQVELGYHNVVSIHPICNECGQLKLS